MGKLGRETYDGFAAWNNTTIIAGNVASEVAKLKDRCDGDILVAGSATLVAGSASTTLSMSTG